jgi:serine protease
MKWSSNEPVPGMRCTRILETAEPAAHSWRNNYLCVPEKSSVHFRWSMAGPLRGMDCVHKPDSTPAH